MSIAKNMICTLQVQAAKLSIILPICHFFTENNYVMGKKELAIPAVETKNGKSK